MRTNALKVLILVFFVTFVCLLINLPKIPIKTQIKNYKIDTSIGGYSINLFSGKFVRDLNLKMGLDIKGGVLVVLDADMAKIPPEEKMASLESAKAVVERRINYLGVSEPSIMTSVSKNTARILVEIPGVSDPNVAILEISQVAFLEFRQLKEGVETPTLVSDFVSSGISGTDLKRALVQFDPNSKGPEISLEFTAGGAKKFEEVTKNNVGKPLAIFLDESVLSSPRVNEAISGGKAVISGDFTLDEANSLVRLINGGSLPVPLKVVSQETVPPSLGIVSLNQSAIAGFIGLFMVMCFMIIIYGRLGIMANIALIVYGIITLAIYKLIPVVLTLPGIAGFILSIGMAVDSNILIFERIKEELRAKKPLSLAMELGFGRAWDSIRDANIATCITCFILFNPFNWSFLNTSGPIRGFALTLFLGIVISLFTGIVVSRNLIRVFYKIKG